MSDDPDRDDGLRCGRAGAPARRRRAAEGRRSDEACHTAAAEQPVRGDRPPPSRACSGIAGLYLATLGRLGRAARCRASLSPRRPATRPIVAATWRTALSKAPGIFQDVAEHPSTIQALASAHRELRDLTDAALEQGRRRIRARPRPGPAAPPRHRPSSPPEWYDETDLLRAAASRVAADPAIVGRARRSGPLSPQELTQAEAAFVEALGTAAADLTVIVGLTDVRRADRAVRRSLERIGIDLPTSISKNYPVATEVLNASDADDEVRCVVRDVVASLERTPAHRIAVLYSAATPYARLLHEHLAAAQHRGQRSGHPAGPRTRDRPDAARGARARRPGSAPRRRVPRAGQRADPRLHRRADPGAAVGAHVPRRRCGSRRRLGHAAGAVRRGRAPYRRSGGGAPRIHGRPRSGARSTTRRRPSGCMRSPSELRRRLSAIAVLETWSELAGGVLQLFHDLLGDYSSLPIEEQYAAVAVESSLKGLSTLDELGTPASLTVLRDVLDLELQQSLPRVGTFGTGVLVAPMSASIGLSADIVYVVGLSEDLYPGRVHEDALLPHRVREAAAPELASFRDRLDEKQRHLLAAFSAGSRQGGGVVPARRPAPIVAALAEPVVAADAALADRRSRARGDAVGPGRVRRPAADVGVVRGIVDDGNHASDEQEWRVRAVSARLWLDDAVVVRARELLRGPRRATRSPGSTATCPGCRACRSTRWRTGSRRRPRWSRMRPARTRSSSSGCFRWSRSSRPRTCSSSRRCRSAT